MHLLWLDLAGKSGADTMEERVAGGEHADAPAGQRQHIGHAGIERDRPRALLALGKRSHQRQMPLAAEDDFRLGDPSPGLYTEPVKSVLADADDG